jgi:glycosyltransferase involved in cell wall biosynthesis
MKIYYVTNARMPTEKAHGIQIAKTIEALIGTGLDMVLVIPRRKTVPESIKEFYDLKTDVPTQYLFSLDFYNKGRVGYFLSSLSFMLSYTLFFILKKIKGEEFILYTVDLDNYSSSFIGFTGVPFFTEMHGGKPDIWPQRFLFKHVLGVITINSIIAEELQKKFNKSEELFIVEPNAVDLEMFKPLDKKTAREKLLLPYNQKIALYTGRLFAWKGLEIFIEAARMLPGDFRLYIVGGTKEEFSKLTGFMDIPDAIICKGEHPQSDIPLWMAAADALIVLGTKRDTQSYYWTSPMKLFEYMTSKRPVIASQTPALEKIVNDTEVVFYEPDNARDLAEKIKYTVDHPLETKDIVSSAYERSQQLSWRGRAERIKNFIELRLLYASTKK